MSAKGADSGIKSRRQAAQEALQALDSAAVQRAIAGGRGQPGRERGEIAVYLHDSGCTFAQVGAVLGVSLERARQIANAAAGVLPRDDRRRAILDVAVILAGGEWARHWRWYERAGERGQRQLRQVATGCPRCTCRGPGGACPEHRCPDFTATGQRCRHYRSGPHHDGLSCSGHAYQAAEREELARVASLAPYDVPGLPEGVPA
jgi:hypothetical protein